MSLLELPPEILSRIFDAYCENICVIIDCTGGDREWTSDLESYCHPVKVRRISAFSTFNLEMTCRKTAQECRAALARANDAMLWIDISVHMSPDMVHLALQEISESTRFTRIRQYVRRINIFKHMLCWSSCKLDWEQFVNAFEKVHEITITTEDGYGFNWQGFKEMVDEVRRGEYSIERLSCTLTYELMEILAVPQALEAKFGTNKYKMFVEKCCKMSTFSYPGEHYFYGYLYVTLSCTPEGWTVHEQSEDFLGNFDIFQKDCIESESIAPASED